MVFPAITLSQPNYSYGCFVVGVVVLVGFDNILIVLIFKRWEVFSKKY